MGISSTISFKGTLGGFLLLIEENTEIDVILKDISGKINEKPDFFKGAVVVGAEGRELDESDISVIEKFLKDEYKVNVKSLKPIPRRILVTEKTITTDEIEKTDDINKIFDGLEEGNTKFVRGTLRSGRSVEFDGNIVVLGDVNPGAVVKGSGNIIIMGSLRGVAHAGASGNDDAYVAANKLQPTQLRISKLITRAPDDVDFEPTMPEIAYIKDNMIVIEPYL
ncbi:MAG: septum site-determining protein MinC [Acidaminobacteraceae bacterium]